MRRGADFPRLAAFTPAERRLIMRLRTPARELECVGQQIDEHLLEERSITDARWQIGELHLHDPVGLA